MSSVGLMDRGSGKSNTLLLHPLCCLLLAAWRRRLTSFTNALHLPFPNHLPKSFFKFKQYFEKFSVPYKHSEVCATCSNCKDECHCRVKGHAIGHLVHISLVKPLSAILTKHWDSLQFSSHNRERTLTDVWDGSSLSNNDDNTVALLASTDGIPLFKSSNVSLWPVSFVILNLPPAIRMYSENIILAGFWIGCKPPMKLLFDPILKSLGSLATSGLKIAAPTTTCTVFIQLVLAIFDLPAKAAVLAAKQYNGKYGCSVCLHPGLRLPNNTRIYLPLQYRERTHSEVVEKGKKAERKGIAVNGIMGTSVLNTALDLVDAVPVDYMHTVLLGVVKMLLNKWFDSSHHRKPFYLGRHANDIDAKLLKQHPPSEFTRRPRSIKSHLKYWKASELRNWFLYYSLPLLVDHLPSLYWHHYALFVSALHILLGDTIAQSSIDIAHQMLCDFCLLIPELYGETMCTHNLLLLTHLTKFVRLWGPLWTHSTFGFKSKNGYLKKFFHGKNIIYQQLVFNSDAIVTLQFLRAQIFEHNPELSVMLNSGQMKTRSNMFYIDQHCYRVGVSVLMLLSTDQKVAINCEDKNDPFECFYRLFKEGEMFHCSSSQNSCARNDTVCIFKHNNTILFGTIALFVLKPSPVALINVHQPKQVSLLHQAGEPHKDTLDAYKNINLLKNFIIPIESRSSSLISVDVKCICRKVVLVETDVGMYIALQPNIYEHH